MLNRKIFFQTLRFVILVATPLCFFNSLVFSYTDNDFLSAWLARFCLNYMITFPQAVLYVTIIKWFDNHKKQSFLP